MDLNEFDDILKNKLEQLSANSSLPDWDRMNASLDDNIFSDEEFDSQVSAKLQQFSGLSSIPDWNRMNAALDKNTLSDQEFDNKVSEKLQQLNSSSYSDSNWSTLYKLIDKRLQNKKRVLVSKAFELSFALLLIFTAFNLGILPEKSKTLHLQEYNQQLFAEAAIPTLTNKPVLSYTKEEIHIASNDPAVSPQNTSFNSNTVGQEQKLNDKQQANNLLHLSSVGKSEDNGKSNSLVLTNDVQSESDLVVTVSTELSPQLIEKVFSGNFGIEELPTKKLIAVPFDYSISPPIAISSATRPHRFFASLQSGYRTNTIESAVHKAVSNRRSSPETSTDIKNSSNAFTSIGLGYRKGKVEIETGLTYEQIEYSPEIILATGSVSNLKKTSIDNIQYDFLSIPLQINVDLFTKNSWKVQLQGGLIGSFLLKAEENISQKIFRGTRISDVPSEDIDNSVLQYNFQEGITSQGNDTPASTAVVNSFSMKSKLGLSISKLIRKDVLIFTEGSYFHQLQLVDEFNSENKDLINTFSVGIGVRKFFG